MSDVHSNKYLARNSGVPNRPFLTGLWDKVNSDEYPNFEWREEGKGFIIKNIKEVEKYDSFKKSLHNWGFKRETDIGGSLNSTSHYWYHPQNLFAQSDAQNNFELLRSMKYLQKRTPTKDKANTCKESSAPIRKLASASSSHGGNGMQGNTFAKDRAPFPANNMMDADESPGMDEEIPKTVHDDGVFVEREGVVGAHAVGDVDTESTMDDPHPLNSAASIGTENRALLRTMVDNFSISSNNSKVEGGASAARPPHARADMDCNGPPVDDQHGHLSVYMSELTDARAMDVVASPQAKCSRASQDDFRGRDIVPQANLDEMSVLSGLSSFPHEDNNRGNGGGDEGTEDEDDKIRSATKMPQCEAQPTVSHRQREARSLVDECEAKKCALHKFSWAVYEAKKCALHKFSWAVYERLYELMRPHFPVAPEKRERLALWMKRIGMEFCYIGSPFRPRLELLVAGVVGDFQDVNRGWEVEDAPYELWESVDRFIEQVPVSLEWQKSEQLRTGKAHNLFFARVAAIDAVANQLNGTDLMEFMDIENTSNSPHQQNQSRGITILTHPFALKLQRLACPMVRLLHLLNRLRPAFGDEPMKKRVVLSQLFDEPGFASTGGKTKDGTGRPEWHPRQWQDLLKWHYREQIKNGKEEGLEAAADAMNALADELEQMHRAQNQQDATRTTRRAAKRRCLEKTQDSWRRHATSIFDCRMDEATASC